MAEVSIWKQQDSLHQRMVLRMSGLCSTLRRHCQSAGALGETKQEDGVDEVREALKALIEALGDTGANADKAASAFGRLGGHQSLLQLLETDGAEADDEIRELAATATELCMSFCPRFPMKAGALDAENDCDMMRCEITIDSTLNKIGAPVKVHLIRRSYPDDTGSRPVITISNMLWAGSIVLVRYLQAAGDGIWQESMEREYEAAEDWAPATLSGGGRSAILEIGAGLGVGGLGAALLAKHLGRACTVHITDCDALSVDMVRSCIRCNGLEGEQGGVVTLAHVLDWDALDEFREQCPEARDRFQLILGAEIVHEMSHAAGVMRAIRELMAEGGRAVLVLGASKHRFGVAEFQELLMKDTDLLHTVADVDPALTHGLESLEEGMLKLQLYSISWAPAAPSATLPLP